MLQYRHMLVIVGLSIVASVAWAGISDGLTDGLISAWTFDDGTAADINGLNNGTLVGDASIVEGHTGLGVDISGPESYVEIPHGPSMDAMSSAFTHAAWAFVEKHGDHGGIMFKGELIGHGPMFHIRLCTVGPTNLSYGTNTVAGAERGELEEGALNPEGWLNSFGVYEEGTWIHMAQTGNGSSVQTYLDGAVVKIDDGFQGPLGLDPAPSAAPYAVFPDFPIILGMALKPDGPKSIDGIIDDAAIFSRALSDSEIAQLASFDFATAVKAEGKIATAWATIKNGAHIQ